jgi:hypothetical protein
MRCVEHEPGEDETADDVAERHRDLVPQPPVRERYLGVARAPAIIVDTTSVGFT